jgi:hypothetical protein
MSAYKFRVLIDTSSNDEIFRDIVVKANDNLESFYNAIVKAFGFKGDQMASFYKSNDDWDKGQEVTLMDMGLSDDSEPVLIMSKTKVKDLVTDPKQKLILVYDFMRMWCFLIELVEPVSKPGSTSPQVVLSVGKAPAEDSKQLDGGLNFGDTPDLGNDFDDIFTGEEDDDESFDDDDIDMEGFSQEMDDNDPY